MSSGADAPNLESMMSFAQLGLPDAIARAAQESGYTEATLIQSEAIPVLLQGRDLVGCSQTGTGKTAAFAMPLLAQVDIEKRVPQVLVLAPTRELAIQVAEAFEQYGSNLKHLRVLAIYGGASYQPQLSALQRGVHVVVGTPGRLIDHIKQNALDVSQIKALVLDEADEMLRMGFIDDVNWILSQTPAERQIALFSATMPAPIREIAQQHLKDPHSITVEKSQKVAQTIRQQHVVVPPKHKVEMLSRILELEQTDGVIVFVKTKLGTMELAERLEARGFRAAPLNGDIAQTQRQRTVDRLKEGDIDVLVATDVAARGLDVDRISHVINYDLPHDQEAYVHRIGRTGRAGRDGVAILLVTPAQRHVIRSLQKVTGQEISQIDGPSVEALNAKRAEGFKQRITEALENRQLGTFAELIKQYCTETGRDVTEVAAAIAVMHQGRRPFFAKPFLDEGRPERRETGDRFSANPREYSRGDKRVSREKPQWQRAESGSSNDRGREFAPRGGAAMKRYRVEVGRTHGVMPGNLVGAIANESGLTGSEIGRIDIYDDHSIVALPDGMPAAVFESLRKTWVAGRQLRLSLAEERSRSGFKGKPFEKGVHGREHSANRETKGRKPRAATGAAPFAKAKGFKKRKATS